MSDNNATSDEMENTLDDLCDEAKNDVTPDLSLSDSGVESQASFTTLSAQSSFADSCDDVSQNPEEPNVSRPTELDACNNPTRAEHLLLELAMHRFFTFPNDWNQAVPKLDLANSGFFFNSARDTVQCIFCKVKISVYMNTNDVNAKHGELSPSCPLMTSAPSCSNVPIGDVTSYRYEANRLYSLLTTNWTAPVNEYDLAKSGFYWTGTSDNCRCVFCRLEVRGWEQNDTADGEHRRWNSNCVFLNERTVGNVRIGQELSPAETGGMHMHINPFGRTPAPFPDNGLGVPLINPPLHTEYADLENRLDSYRLWPLCMPQRQEELSEAGFFYTGRGDRVICFLCGGGLKEYAGSTSFDPFVEHARWFPHCGFIRRIKGDKFVDSHKSGHVVMIAPAEGRIEDRLTPPGSELGSTTGCNPFLGPENVTEFPTLVCGHCNERPVSVLHLPCRHVSSCTMCAHLRCSRCNETSNADIPLATI